MPPEWLQVNGHTLVNSGITNADGSIVGYALVSGSSGAPAPFIVTATQYYTNNDYTFNGIQVSNVMVQSLTVVSNSATPIDATNWAVVKTPTDDYVIVQATLSITNDWFLTNAALQAEAGAAIQWTGGEPMPGNPLQCRVSKIVSTNITVTATLGSSSASLNVWVIWSTISYQFSGTTPLNAQGLWTNLNSSGDSNSDLSLFCPGVILGVQNYFTNLWPLGYTWPVGNGIGYSAWAKMCVIATLTPSGIGGLITNDWKICQMFMAHEFPDRTTNTTAYFDGWNDDSPGDHRRTHIPVDDKVYAIDAPPIEENQYYITLNRTSAVCTNSFEMHDNFYNYVAWIWAGTTNICSLTNNFWHFQGGWANGQTQISPVDLGTNSIIPLPTSPQY
jgi:hypothetical protein